LIALPFSETNCLFISEAEDLALQELLGDLSQKKISWKEALQRIPDLGSASRAMTKPMGRSLLHLAVLDNQLDIIALFKKDPVLKVRRDVFGLSPMDLAQLLHRKEAMQHLASLKDCFSMEPGLPDGVELEYLPAPYFETQEGLEQVLYAVAKVKAEDKIPEETIWLGVYFDREIQTGAHPPILIDQVHQNGGYGVFAEKKISPCTFVGEYTGQILQHSKKPITHIRKKLEAPKFPPPCEKGERRDKNYCLRYTVWDEKSSFSIDATTKGNFTRFINHSERPNVGLQPVYWRGVPRMIFISLKEIEAGEQLGFGVAQRSIFESCSVYTRSTSMARV